MNISKYFISIFLIFSMQIDCAQEGTNDDIFTFYFDPITGLTSLDTSFCNDKEIEKGVNQEIIKNDQDIALDIAKAINFKNYNLMLRLLALGNSNALVNNKTSLLNYAVLNNDTTAVTILLQHKANPNLTDTRGITPLMIASSNGNAFIVIKLLKHKANPYQKDNQQLNSFDYAHNNMKAFLALKINEIKQDNSSK